METVCSLASGLLMQPSFPGGARKGFCVGGLGRYPENDGYGDYLLLTFALPIKSAPESSVSNRKNLRMLGRVSKLDGGAPCQ